MAEIKRTRPARAFLRGHASNNGIKEIQFSLKHPPGTSVYGAVTPTRAYKLSNIRRHKVMLLGVLGIAVAFVWFLASVLLNTSANSTSILLPEQTRLGVVIDG